jgi:hypothetical protein
MREPNTVQTMNITELQHVWQKTPSRWYGYRVHCCEAQVLFDDLADAATAGPMPTVSFHRLPPCRLSLSMISRCAKYRSQP